jgi:hypothetical protein
MVAMHCGEQKKSHFQPSERKHEPLESEHGIPDFYFVHAGTKPRFMTKKGHQKSGILCSDWNEKRREK